MGESTELGKVVVEELGFESEQEFHRLVACVVLRDSCDVKTFKKWQSEDGTKEGLLKLLD